MWEINSKLQLLSFLRSMILGGIFCVFYDIFRVKRAVFKTGNAGVFFEDILYFTVIAPVTFLFLLATTGGDIRFYILFGMVVGFSAVRYCLSQLLVSVLKTVLIFICRVLRIVKGFFDGILEKIFQKSAIFIKKAENSCKKLLKKWK